MLATYAHPFVQSPYRAMFCIYVFLQRRRNQVLGEVDSGGSLQARHEGGRLETFKTKPRKTEQFRATPLWMTEHDTFSKSIYTPVLCYNRASKLKSKKSPYILMVDKVYIVFADQMNTQK